VSIAESSLEGAIACAKSAAERSPDLLEIRFDHINPLPSDLSAFRDIGVPMIATLRSAAQGGRYAGPDETKLAFLKKAIGAGFKVVDLESGSAPLARAGRELKGAEIICSSHNFDFTPDASTIIETLVGNAAKGDVAKAAFKINSVKDLLAIVDAAKGFSSTEKEFVLIGMGELGEITRICTKKIGSIFSYASLEKGKEAAPGQLDIDTMKALGDDPIVTGITGHPLGHSASPSMHNAAFRALGIEGRYLSLPAKEEELEDLLNLMVDLDVRGVNVTIPHKESVILYLDSLDETSSRTGAVNTVLNKEGMLTGFNTDLHGIAMTFQKAGVTTSGKKALVIGAGGAARACCSFLLDGGAKVSVTNRTRSRADALAGDFRVEVIERKDAESASFDIIINCTPLGMKGFPEGIPLFPEAFHENQFVLDTIYNPPVTPFLEEAGRRGAITASGLDMLIHQAVKAFELWTGVAPPYGIMAEGAKEALS
ncbi:MAG: shikimate dehydrogenase, partial [Euryarchaeota archaeon]|nr:shikimate dehydrogenase [Euryarchaeota archaeon]